MEKILIVDDRPINREVLSILLDEYEILEADDGLKALEVARHTQPDLIITDILMPKMDGLALVEALKADPVLKYVPIIFYSAKYETIEAEKLAVESNVKYVLTKPCPPEVLLNSIREALGSCAKPFKDNKADINSYDLKKKEQQENINLRLTNLIEIGLDMSQEYDIEKIIYLVCKAGRQFLDACHAGIILQSLSGEEQYTNYVIGQDNVIETFEFEDHNLSPSLKHIFLESDPALLHSPIVDMESIGLKGISLPFSSLLAIPIETARFVYGKMYFVYKSPNKFFTASDQRFMMTLAHRFAISYENLLLYQEIEKYSLQLQEEVRLKRTTEAGANEVLSDAALACL